MITGSKSQGALFRGAMAGEKPLQVVGAVNAYAAIMAERAGFRAIYLSGAGVANASFGLPDLGMTTLSDVLEDARRITGATGLPLLVDADTGWGDAFMIGRTVREMIRAGAAGIHIEDQVAEKRCGQRPGKRVVSTGEMAARIKAAVDARTDPGFPRLPSAARCTAPPQPWGPWTPRGPPWPTSRRACPWCGPSGL